MTHVRRRFWTIPFLNFQSSFCSIDQCTCALIYFSHYSTSHLINSIQRIFIIALQRTYSILASPTIWFIAELCSACYWLAFCTWNKLILPPAKGLKLQRTHLESACTWSWTRHLSLWYRYLVPFCRACWAHRQLYLSAPNEAMRIRL
jgi:hypothetical protein